MRMTLREHAFHETMLTVIGLVQHPLRSLWAVLLLLTWFALLAQVPTLALVGAGLVPALIVRLTLEPPVSQASRS